MATGTIKQVMNNSGSNYCKMPDGTLMQWGAYNHYTQNATSDEVEITFPLTFYAKPIVVLTGHNDDRLNYKCNSMAIKDRDVDKFIAVTTRPTDGWTGGIYHWIAIGRWK